MRTPLPRAGIALIVLAALLAACTRHVPREQVQVRAYRVDWSTVDAPVLQLGGLRVQGVVLTPSQWPLETSLRRLLEGDFMGVVTGLDFGFRSSAIPEGALEALFEAGFVPAYVRIENPGPAGATFRLERLAVLTDGDRLLEATAPDLLPGSVRRIDWVQTGAAVVVVALLVVVLAAGREGRIPQHTQVADRLIEGFWVDSGSIRAARERDRRQRAAAAALPQEETGLLRSQPLAPGESREGFLLFSGVADVVDWSDARLIGRP